MNMQPLEITGLSRRRFLGAVLAGAGVVAALGRSARATAGEELGSLNGARLLTLSDAHAVTLAAFAESVLPQGPGLPSIGDTHLIQRFDEEFFFADAAVRADMQTALTALEWLPVASGILHHFSTLPLGRRAEFVAQLVQSRFETPRSIANSLRVVVHFFHYAHPATWALSGYDGPFSHLGPQLSEQRLHYLALTKAKA